MGKRWGAVLGLVTSIVLAVWMSGCSQGDAVKAASAIHAYLPAVSGLAQDAIATAAEVDPAEAQALQTVSAKVQTDLQELESVSGAYAAAPSADGWARLGAVMDELVSDSDQGLLAALAIKNPTSQGRAKAALSALDAAVHVLDGCLMAARSPDEVKASAAKRTVKVQSVVRYWSPQDWQKVEQAFGARSEALADAGRLGL